MSTELTPDFSISSMHLYKASNPNPMLLTLPVELQEAIIENLLTADFPAKFNLRTTCHYFYNLIKRPTHKELLAAEKSRYACTKKLFTCGDCLRLLPESKFDEYMLSSRPKDGCAWDRLCIECGHKYPLWGERRGELKSDAPQQTPLGEDWGICVQCGRLEMAHIFTNRSIATNEAMLMTNCYCSACLRWFLSRPRVEECTLNLSRVIGSTIPRPSSPASSDEEFSGVYHVLGPPSKLVRCFRRLLCLGN